MEPPYHFVKHLSLGWESEQVGLDYSDCCIVHILALHPYRRNYEHFFNQARATNAREVCLHNSAAEKHSQTLQL